jgi:hypothetical protein
MARGIKGQDSEVLFVQVAEPDEIRRDILESLKEILETLQRFEKFRRTRHDKLEKIQHLRKLVKETHKLMGNLKLRLPQTSFKVTAPKEPKPAKKSQKQKEAPKKEARKRTELDRLEEELSAIESKLKSFT